MTRDAPGCFICRPEAPEFSDVEGCSACEADWLPYFEVAYADEIVREAGA